MSGHPTILKLNWFVADRLLRWGARQRRAVVVAFCAFLATSGCLGIAVGQPLNIVLLYADDWRHDTLSCAGHPIVQTPQIDRLAARGVRFRHSYVTTSICGVSRASLLTGQWMSRHGNRAFGPFQTPWEATYPGLLRDHGYHVGHVGKWHNGPFPADHYDVGLAYGATHWHREPDGGQIHVTQKNERDALRFLRERPRDRLFCLTIAFFAPHAEDAHPEQFLPQPASMPLYRDVQVPFPVNGSDDDFRKLPALLAQPKNEGRVRWRWRFDTPERYQASMKNYFRLITEIDAVCGAVLDELETQGLFDRTMVVFTTDNGYFHGEHGLADKWYPYEESIRVPLVMWDPRMEPSQQGAVRQEMVLNVDLAPTFVAAAQLAPPPGMQGRDLSALYTTDAPPADWRAEFYYEHPMITSADRIPASAALVRKDIKYIYWPDVALEQLFDLAKDPGENFDLIGDPTRDLELALLRRRFAELEAAAR